MNDEHGPIADAKAKYDYIAKEYVRAVLGLHRAQLHERELREAMIGQASLVAFREMHPEETAA